MAAKENNRTINKIETTAQVVNGLQTVADNHGVDADILVANGRNRRHTLTPVIVHARGTTGASEWEGRGASGRRGVIIVASQVLRQYNVTEIDALIQAAGIVLGILESGDEEAIKALNHLAKGNMPKGPKGISPLLADNGLRFASADKARGLDAGSQRDNLRFANIGKVDAKCGAIIEAIKSSYHGCTEVDKDGNELSALDVNAADAAAAAEREARRLANEALAAEYKAKGLVKVNGMWMAASHAKILAPMFKERVDKDALNELKAYQRGLVLSQYVNAKVKAATVRAEAKAETATAKVA